MSATGAGKAVDETEQFLIGRPPADAAVGVFDVSRPGIVWAVSQWSIVSYIRRP